MKKILFALITALSSLSAYADGVAGIEIRLTQCP